MNFRDNIRTLVETFDTHDPGVLTDGTHQCACGWVGTEQEWLLHLADSLNTAVTVVQLAEVL